MSNTLPRSSKRRTLKSPFPTVGTYSWVHRYRFRRDRYSDPPSITQSMRIRHPHDFKWLGPCGDPSGCRVCSPPFPDLRRANSVAFRSHSHEIAGVAVRVGSKVRSMKVGDRVGVGAQIGSCYSCRPCTSDNEQYCAKPINTYVHIQIFFPDLICLTDLNSTGR